MKSVAKRMMFEDKKKKKVISTLVGAIYKILRTLGSFSPSNYLVSFVS